MIEHNHNSSVAGLMSVLIQTVAIIAVTWVAILSCSALISVLLNVLLVQCLYRRKPQYPEKTCGAWQNQTGNTLLICDQDGILI